MVSSLLYVSHSRIPDQDASGSIQEMVAAAKVRNRRLNVTGALLFTGKHFAQIIEGERESVELLWADIQRDPRHDKLVLLEHSTQPKRRFADWTLAFSGPSEIMTRQVARLSHDRSEAQYRRTAQWLTDLLSKARENGAGDDLPANHAGTPPASA